MKVDVRDFATDLSHLVADHCARQRDLKEEAARQAEEEAGRRQARLGCRGGRGRSETASGLNRS